MFRKPSPRHFLVVAMLALAGTLTFLVVRNFQWSDAEEIAASLPLNADLALKEVRYTEMRDGVRRWTLVADAAAHALREGITRIENIRMVFHDVEGVGELTLTASRGEMRTPAQDIELQGDVVITSPRGYAFYTDRLHYREAERQAWTDAPVRIVSEKMELTGTGMRLDVRAHTFELLSGVRARIAGAG